jgi:hypothetical protein
MALSVGLRTLFDRSAPGIEVPSIDAAEKERDISADGGVYCRHATLSVAVICEVLTTCACRE